MVPHHTTKGSRRYPYYVCGRQQKQGAAACPGSRVAAGKLESFVLDQLRSVGRDPKLLEATVAAERAARESRKPELITEARRLRAERARIEGERRNVVDAVAQGGSSSGVLMQKLAELDSELGQASARLDQVIADLAALKAELVDPEELRAALADLEPIWAELFPSERARVLALLLERVEFDAAAGEVAITFRPGAPRGVMGEVRS